MSSVDYPSSIPFSSKSLCDLPPAKPQGPWQDQQTPTDSGYSSSSQPTHDTQVSFSVKQTIVALPERSLFPGPTRVELPIFSRETDQRSYQRFRAIRGPIEQLLGRYLIGKKKAAARQWRQADVAARLLVLGDCEAEAKDHVVVFCPPWMCKQARRFYRKDPTVRELLKPTDGMSPSFSIVVADGFATVARTDIEVFGTENQYSDHTFCGQPIYFRNGAGCVAQTTLGGAIKITWKDGTTGLYGLTAAHAIFALAASRKDADEDSGEHSDDDESSLGDETESRRSFSDDSDDSASTFSEQDKDCVFPVPTASPEIPHDARSLAHVFHISTDRSRGYFDWALMEMNTSLPNVLLNAGGFIEKPISVGPIHPPPESGVLPLDSRHRDVILADPVKGPRYGKICGMMGRIKISPGDAFTDAYMVTLADGPISKGVSGAWVVEAASMKVVGHVVGTDMTGDAYVLPMTNILADVCSELGAQEASIASETDVRNLSISSTKSQGSRMPTAADPEHVESVTNHASSGGSRSSPGTDRQNTLGTSLLGLRNDPLTLLVNADASQAFDNATSSPTRVFALESSRSKRKVEDTDDEASHKDKKLPPKRRKAPQRRSSESGQTNGSRFACPYFVRYPQSHKGCARFAYKGVGDLKKHLSSLHELPPNSCEQCGRSFSCEGKLLDHLRLGEPCESPNHAFGSRGFGPIQKEQIQAIAVGLARSEKWYRMWEILFPDTTSPSSPWHHLQDGSEVEDGSDEGEEGESASLSQDLLMPVLNSAPSGDSFFDWYSNTTDAGAWILPEFHPALVSLSAGSSTETPVTPSLTPDYGSSTTGDSEPTGPMAPPDSGPSSTRHANLAEDQLDYLGTLHSVFESPEEHSRELSGQGFPSCSYGIPFVSPILDDLNTRVEGSGESGER